jgi:hypothetical protein
MADKSKENVTDLKTGLHDLTPEQQEMIASKALDNGKNTGEGRIIGYILAPEVLVGLLDICEDIPGRYYKKIVPALQSSSQLVEDKDGTARIINPNS